MSEFEVEDHVKAHPDLKWAIYQGIIYDVKDYGAQHPGGSDVLFELNGKSIDEAFEDQGHSKTAKNLFKDLPKRGLVKGASHDASDSDTQGSEKGLNEDGASSVAGLYGYELKGKWQPDYNKGLLWQLWKLNPSHADYMKYIEEPKILVNPPRNVILFDIPFIEKITRAEWWHLPTFWSVIIVYFLVQSPLDLISTILTWVVGYFAWTFAEYVLHRYLFHGELFWVTDHRPVKIFHFMIHGFHHAFPQDSKRIVFPIAPASIFFLGMLLPSICLFIPTLMHYAFKSGFLAGYITYAMVHYSTHCVNLKSAYLKDLKKYHMLHHYRDGVVGFGVSNKIWDKVFGTEIIY